jgi:tetraacyldisaccharide 4'-kinase
MEVPVIVIGNITIGGTGKTPLVIWMLEQLLRIGIRPGLICSGFNSRVKSPQEVFIDSKVSDVGDEALMIKLRFNKTNNKDIPIFVGKKKVQVGKALLSSYPNINILISDDGLQHYELKRDFEIAVIDEVRKYGNKFLIPAGPLREPITRLNMVDALIVNSRTSKELKNGYRMNYFGDVLVNCLQSNRTSNIDTLEKEIVAITGIGHPERFFEQLTTFGIKFKKVIFNDHHMFNKSDFKDYASLDIIMTEKDAVKCKSFAKENFWYLPIYANVEERLFKKIIKKLRIK